jgi:hypothetical protein
MGMPGMMPAPMYGGVDMYGQPIADPSMFMQAPPMIDPNFGGMPGVYGGFGGMPMGMMQQF